MKNLLNHLLIFFGFVLVLSACKKPVEEKEPEVVEEAKMSQTQIDSLGFVYVSVKDSLDANWMLMIQDDDEKLADMKLLLQEVSKTRRYDKNLHQELTSEIDQLAQIRYDRKSMKDSHKIDEYDSATSIVTKDVILFAANLPQYNDYPKLEEIISDIQSADNRVILHRIRYDRSAKGFNHFIHENEKYMNHLVSDQSALSEAPLFELSN